MIHFHKHDLIHELALIVSATKMPIGSANKAFEMGKGGELFEWCYPGVFKSRIKSLRVLASACLALLIVDRLGI